MGLEMFSLQNKAVSILEGRESDRRLLIGTGILLLYLLIGAIIFVRLEYPLEKIERETYKEYRQQWTDRLTAVGIPAGAAIIKWLEEDRDVQSRHEFAQSVQDFMNRNSVSEEEIDRLFEDIRDAALNGIWVEKNFSGSPNWSFGQAFFFSGTLISTVGYGRVSPRTEHGKLFTIIYCIIGIPITLALLSAVVSRMKTPSLWLRGILNRRLASLFHPGQIQFFHLSLVCALLLIFVFVIPSWIFTSIEPDWTFLDAFYYCFVSLTTIGLGDYEPGDHPDQPLRGLYKILATLYLLLGLACMMLFLATLYEMPQLNLTRFFLNTEEEDRILDENKEPSKYTRYTEETEMESQSQSYDNGFYQP